MPSAFRRLADPEVVQAIGAYLATVPPEELADIAAQDGDMAERLRRGPLGFMGPIGARMALGAERVEEMRQYGVEDFVAILDGLADSRPAHHAILAANVPWFLDQMRRLQTIIVSG
jgi:hypothetical protein